jgi:uncharacterized protein YjbJ (UPF0337 family)
MTKFSRGLLALLFAGGIAFAATGCGQSSSANQCDKVVDKAFTMLTEAFGDMMGEMTDEQKAEFEAEKKEAVAECQKALEANPEEAKKAIDCFLAADSFEEAEECPELPDV